MHLELDRPDWSAAPSQRVVERLTEVPLAWREAAWAGPKDRATHRRHFDQLPALREIERGGAPAAREEARGGVRVLFWNVERLRHKTAIEATLRTEAPDVALLCEIDRGMARTGNIDCMADLAARLGHGYAYAVEFVELGLGDIREQRDHAGETNARGFHGAALLTDLEIRRPFLVRIDTRGDWFDGSRHEPRIGGTIALGAQFLVDGQPVTMVSVHLESHGDPAERAADTGKLLALIQAYDPQAPVVLGGDFNTSSASVAERWQHRALWLHRVREEPDLLTRPQLYEPLFGVLAAAGYDWHGCNVPDVPTQRFSVDDPGRPRAKLDWFFTRGLLAEDAAIIPALRPDGGPSSDHDALAVTIRPR